MRYRLVSILFVAVLGISFIASVWTPKPASADTTEQGYSYAESNDSVIIGPGTTIYHENGNCNQYTASGHTIHVENTAGKCGGTNGSFSALSQGTTCNPNRSGCSSSTTSGSIRILPSEANGPFLVGSWVDHSEITSNQIISSNSNQTFIDNKIDGASSNDALKYVASGNSNGCSDDYIDGFSASDYPGNSDSVTSVRTANDTAIVHIFEPSFDNPNDTNCVEYDQYIQFAPSSDDEYFLDFFAWADAGTIATTDASDSGTGHTFIGSAGQPYIDQNSGDGNCKSSITVTGGADGPQTTGKLIVSFSGNEPFTDGWPGTVDGGGTGNITAAENAVANSPQVEGCHTTKPIPITIANPIGADNKFASQEPAGSSALGQNSGGSGGTDTNATSSLTCSAGYNPLNYLLCAVVKGLVDIVGSVDNLINSLLSIGSQGNNDTPVTIFGGGSDNHSAAAYKAAWSSFRDIALGLLLIVGLVIILSQAMGLEILDAYTVRKAMPRLVIAAVAITLSWELLELFVQFTNDLGYGIRYLILDPFSSLPDKINLGGGGSIATSLLALGALGALGIFGLLSFVATAALAVFVAYLVLIIRQILIIVLIIFSPIAIVANILPNTQKIYKLWWDSLSKGLLMFPIIAAFIASGRAFSAVARENPGAVDQLMAIAAYFAPYFLLPLTFRFAGGALANIGGFVNDRHKGGFDRLKKFRNQQPAKRLAAAQKGELYKERRFIPGSGALSHRANRIAQGGTMGPGKGFGLGGVGKQRAASLFQANSEEWLKSHGEAAKTLVAQDDTAALLALSGGNRNGAKRAQERLRNHWSSAAMAANDQEVSNGTMSSARRDVLNAQVLADADKRSNDAMNSATAIGINDLSAGAALTVMGQNKSRSIATGNYGLVQQGIHDLAHGNTALEEDIGNSFQFNSRNSGRQDLGGNWNSKQVTANKKAMDANNAAVNNRTMTAAQRDTANAQLESDSKREILMDGVARTENRQLVGGHNATVEAVGAAFAADLASGDVGKALKSAQSLREVQGNLTSATGGSRDELKKIYDSYGIDLSSGRGVSEQLADVINSRSAGAPAVNEHDIEDYARVWGGGIPAGAAAAAAAAGRPGGTPGGTSGGTGTPP
jgi:hypothetical protein